MTDQPTLRDRIRRLLAEADGFSYDCLEPHDYQRHADAILALPGVLPAPVDRVGDVDRLQNKILELEADLATVKDLLRTENKRANDAIAREETAEQAAIEAQQDRTTVLREAAVRYEEFLAKASPEQDPRYWTAVRDITLGLRRMADEAQPPEGSRRIPIPGIPECGADCPCRRTP